MEPKFSCNKESKKRRAQQERYNQTKPEEVEEVVFENFGERVTDKDDDLSQRLNDILGPPQIAQNYIMRNEESRFLGADLSTKIPPRSMAEIMKPIFSVLSYRNRAPLFHRHPAPDNVAPSSPYQPKIYSSQENPKFRHKPKHPAKPERPKSPPANNLDDNFSDSDNDQRWDQGMQRWMESSDKPQLESASHMSPNEKPYSAQSSNRPENTENPGKYAADPNNNPQKPVAANPSYDSSSTDSDAPASPPPRPASPRVRHQRPPKFTKKSKPQRPSPGRKDYKEKWQRESEAVPLSESIEGAALDVESVESYQQGLQLKFNIPGVKKKEKKQPKISDAIKKRKAAGDAHKPAKKPKTVMRHPVNVILNQQQFLPLIVTVAVRTDCDGLLLEKNNRQRHHYAKGKKKLKVAQKYRSIVASRAKQEGQQATDIIKRASVVEVCPASTSSAKQSSQQDDKRQHRPSQVSTNHKRPQSPRSPFQPIRERGGGKEGKKRPGQKDNHCPEEEGESPVPPRPKKKKYQANEEENVLVSNTNSFKKKNRLQNGFEEAADESVSGWQQQKPQSSFQSGQFRSDARSDYNVEDVIRTYDSTRFIKDARDAKHRADGLQKVLTELGKQKHPDHVRILRVEVERVWSYFNASLKYSIGGYKMDIGEEGYEKYESKNTLSIYKSTIDILNFVKDSIKKIQKKSMVSSLKNQLNRLYVFCLKAVSVLSMHVYKIQKDYGRHLIGKIKNVMSNSKSNAGVMTSQLGDEKVADSPAMPMLPQSSPMLNQPGPSPAAGSTCSSNTSEHVSSSTQIKTGSLLVPDKLDRYLVEYEDVNKHLPNAISMWQEATELQFSDQEFFHNFNKIANKEIGLFSSVKDMYVHMLKFADQHQPKPTAAGR